MTTDNAMLELSHMLPLAPFPFKKLPFDYLPREAFALFDPDKKETITPEKLGKVRIFK